jgi:transposase-like protein
MPKNPIQFQKGISLPDFLTKYGTDNQCLDSLIQFRWPNGFVCPACANTTYYQIKTRALFQCKACRRQTSVISGTIFASTKLPLSIWFLGIYLVTQSKDGISSLNLARSLGISANAALRMKHKLQHVMKTREDSKPLSGFLKIDDAYLGGKRRGGKRGRGAPGKTPFIAAVATDKDGNPLSMKFSMVRGFTNAEIKSWTLKHVRSKSVIVSDGLQCFRGVADADCTHEAIVTGGGPDSVEHSEFKWLNTMIGNVKNSIRGTYHSISKKHVPRYLAEFCYRFNRRFNLAVLIERFTYVAVRTNPMPQRLLKLAEVRW